MKITLSNPAMRWHVVLSAPRRKAFLRELTRVRHHKPAVKVHLGAAADYIITVKEPGRPAKTYRIYGRVLLREEPKHRQAWQFYMGLLLFEWLVEPYRATLPSAPFNPARP